MEDKNSSGQYRENIHLGMEVDIVLKKDQRTGQRTRGFVRAILTSKPYHSRGIKVMLHTRQVGRVQEIVGPGKPLGEVLKSM
jgi:uncharacterized repeat protein (TIGR03833 family)